MDKMTLYLLDGAGLACVTGTLHTLGDAQRAARQWRLTVGSVEDGEGRRVAVITHGVVVRVEQEEQDDGARCDRLQQA